MPLSQEAGYAILRLRPHTKHRPRTPDDDVRASLFMSYPEVVLDYIKSEYSRHDVTPKSLVDDVNVWLDKLLAAVDSNAERVLYHGQPRLPLPGFNDGQVTAATGAHNRKAPLSRGEKSPAPSAPSSPQAAPPPARCVCGAVYGSDGLAWISCSNTCTSAHWHRACADAGSVSADSQLKWLCPPCITSGAASSVPSLGAGASSSVAADSATVDIHPQPVKGTASAAIGADIASAPPLL